jgi:hypothetical protein
VVGTVGTLSIGARDCLGLIGSPCAAIDTWGSTADERAAAYPCDELLVSPDRALFRAVDVAASPATAFRWLCQLRVAPYSYDWIDNRGRRSPRDLTPGLEDLAVGQRAMTIFELVGFEPARDITMRTDSWLFGEVFVTYRVSEGAHGSRLVAKLLVRYPRSSVGRVMRHLLPAGDLFMMRKQLLTLAALAERDHSMRRQ